MKKIICIDSDGCVMDTMNYKHMLAFGPIAVEVYNIKKEKEFLEIWNNINLFSKTRGVNRFIGLYLSFEKLNKIDSDVQKLNELKEWIDNTKELSNNSLKQQIDITNSDELKKVLEWSEKVNNKIASLKGKDKVFDGVKEAFSKMRDNVDIAIVSSANKEAILEEWTRHSLLPYVKYIMGQDRGSKYHCLEILKEEYDEKNILLIGDSPGDLEASIKAKVQFYPIIFDDEKNSWNEFKDKVLDEFLNDEYLEKEYIDKYMNKLNSFY